MPFEFVADFDYSSSLLTADDVRWGKIARALTMRILATEPKARVVLRSLPPPNQPRHLVYRIKPDVAKTLPETLAGRCEIPAGRWELIRQYFCKSPSCAPAGERKWFPKMYLALHQGHDIEHSEPTGRSQKFSWQPNYRLFFGSVARLAGSVPVTAAGCVTGLHDVSTAELEALRRFDWMFVEPGGFPPTLKTVASLGIKVSVLSSPVDDLLAWMRREDAKLIETDAPSLDEGEFSPDAVEALKKRIGFANRVIASKIDARVAGEAKKSPGLIE